MSVDLALSWLNRENLSCLSNSSRFWIDHFHNADLEDEERLETINSLVQTVPGIQDPLEQAEVLTYCAVFLYRMRRVDEAVQRLKRANDIYQYVGDGHRQAVTCWMLYRTMRAQGSYARAFDQGKRARALMQVKAGQYALQQLANTESWYRARIIEFTVELVSTPEDMFEWLFEFHASRMSPAAAQVRARLRDFIERRLFPQAEQEMRVLIDMTRAGCSVEETGEAQACCGIAEWVMEHQMNALYFFRAALSQYIPGGHEYAVLTWILGLGQNTFPNLRAKSFGSMQSAVDQFDALRVQAIRLNDPTRRDWYALHHVAMERVLRQRIAGQP